MRTATSASSFLAHCDEHGVVKVFDRKGFYAYAAEHFPNQECVVTVQSKTEARSLRANAYYWSTVVQAAVDETGQDADTMHAFWCEQFIPSERKRLEFINKMTGQITVGRVETRRSSKLDGHDFYDFVEQCRLWLATWLGVTTPDPDADYWRKRPRKARETTEATP